MVVIDTSVAYKWFDANEIDADTALKLLNSHISNQAKIIVPDLLLYELANVWSTKGTLNVNQIKDNLKTFKQYQLKIKPISLELIEKAIEISKQHQISVYDAAYAVLANEEKCHLVTADEKLANKLKLPFIKKLSEITSPSQI